MQVDGAVRMKAVDDLNQEKNSLSKSSSLPDSDSLQTSKYLYHFKISHSCLLFRVRSRTIDIKEAQSFKYGNDMECRGCGDCPETVHHVLCECPALKSEKCNRGDEYSELFSTLEKVVLRAEEFMELIDTEEVEECENGEEYINELM